MTGQPQQGNPECVHYILCCSAQIMNASGCIGKDECKFYGVSCSSPAPEPALDEESIFFDITPDGDGRNRIYANFYQVGTLSIEVKKEELERLHSQLGKFLGSTTPSSPATAAEIPTDSYALAYWKGHGDGAKAERENLLGALMGWITDYCEYSSGKRPLPKIMFSGCGMQYDFKQKLESLRSQSDGHSGEVRE